MEGECNDRFGSTAAAHDLSTWAAGFGCLPAATASLPNYSPHHLDRCV